MRRTKSIQRTLSMVDRAVTHDKAEKIQNSASTSKAKAMSAIKEREKKADARVRQRLLERRNKQKKTKQNKQIKSWQVEPTKQNKTEVGNVKRQLVKKIKTKERLRNIFGKLDLDGDGVLSKNEFIRMIVGILKKRVNRNGLECCWEAAWDIRKHGGNGELDAGTVAHWLELD